ncbi:MAG TPA: VWA domain-containing protein [Bryobacteraceae bacterium]|nr:VWA domain-containing protein [Bryobacteraceae bacterium]
MRIVTLVLTLASISRGLGQQAPTIRVPVRLVSLSTLVFSKNNQLIAGLEPHNFHVLDNGRRQNIRLDQTMAPVSIVLAIQTSQNVREYLPIIARVGSAVDSLLAGESGEAAVMSYNAEVAILKTFDAGDVRSALRNLSAKDPPARMIDAGIRAVTLLRARPASRSRVLLFIGQPVDRGSESQLADLEQQASKADLTVYALTLPEFGKDFVSDTFSLGGVSRAERGGFKAGLDLGRLVTALNRNARVQSGADPFSILTATTGGTQFHFRKQRQLEDALAAIGITLRSSYQLSYYPSSDEPGYHVVTIAVDVPGAKVYSRLGYWLSAE